MLMMDDVVRILNPKEYSLLPLLQHRFRLLQLLHALHANEERRL
jgi:hypothetical protein